VTATFAVGSLLTVAALAATTYGLSSRYLLSQRETSAVRQAQANARLTRSLLRTPDADVPRLLASLGAPSSARSLVRLDDEWFAASPAVSPDLLPADLEKLVLDERVPGRQRAYADGLPVVAVGLPLDANSAYFEVFPLAELSRTLATIRFSLIAASAVAFVGSIALGSWASSRVLRPVGDIGRAAAAIAAGRMDARLDVGGDAELFALATGFNAMVDSLQERIDRDARFASDVSHELRSPLTTLRSAVEIMQGRQAALDPRSRRALDLLAEEVDRFEHLVQDLLEISRYDAGVANLDLEPVDVVALLRRTLAEESASPVDVTLEGADAVEAIDRRRIEQALRNLVRNADSYGGGVVCAGVRAEPSSITVWVEDHGAGVPGPDREAVFQRFFRGATAGRRSSSDGAGLGLALVKEHVTLHHGQVWVEEVIPNGARFLIQLPRRPA
jgi:signal transduction histidine kinase